MHLIQHGKNSTFELVEVVVVVVVVAAVAVAVAVAVEVVVYFHTVMFKPE